MAITFQICAGIVDWNRRWQTGIVRKTNQENVEEDRETANQIAFIVTPKEPLDQGSGGGWKLPGLKSSLEMTRYHTTEWFTGRSYTFSGSTNIFPLPIPSFGRRNDRVLARLADITAEYANRFSDRTDVTI